MEIKINDVYRFFYNEKKLKKLCDAYWCFDGQLIVKSDNHGNLLLVDTYYWGENKSFTLEEALECGTLEFVCNLDEVEPIHEYEICDYEDKDIFNLSRQHYCYKQFYKRKGATKSIEKIKQNINNKISDLEEQVRFNEDEIKTLVNKLENIESWNVK